MISGKLWGSTQELFSSAFASFHRADVKAGYRCSRHRHDRKWNGFFVESGILEIRIYQPSGTEDVTRLTAGEFTAVGPGVEHRFECLADTILFEAYWLEVIGDDIIRADEGGRLEPR